MEEKHKRNFTFNYSHLCNPVHREIAQMLVQADWRQQAQGRIGPFLGEKCMLMSI